MLREVPGHISSTRTPVQNFNNDNNNDMETSPETRQEHTTQELHDDIFGSEPNSPAIPSQNLSNDFDDLSISNQSQQPPSTNSNVLNPDSSVPSKARSSSTSEITSNPSFGERSDIPRLRSMHVTSGYRDGISVSKAEFVQAGFDEGFSLGAIMGLRTGHLLGILEGVVRAVNTKLNQNGVTEGYSEGARDDIVQLYVKAKEELGLQSLFAREWFGEDGIWKYDVEGEDNEVDFRKVVEAHPVVKRWSSEVETVMKRFGVVVREREREGDDDEEEV